MPPASSEAIDKEAEQYLPSRFEGTKAFTSEGGDSSLARW